jgi:hypothetical protein
MSTFPTRANGAADIDHILTQESNRIGQDILRQSTHISPWIDLIPKAVFPSGMGYQLNSLVYDRVLPLTPDSGYGSVGMSWDAVGASALITDNTNQGTGILEASSPDRLGPNATTTLSRVDFSRIMRQYNLERAVVRSPEINVDDLRFAAYRNEQLRAIIDLMAEATRWSWEERHRDEYLRLTGVGGSVIECKTASTAIVAGSSLTGYIAANGPFQDAVGGATANGSNSVFDKLYYKMVRSGAGMKAYGNEGGRPIFGLICSSELSYNLKTETGFRDDMRENSARVSELVGALGVSGSFRGYYHLIDDLAPRFNLATAGQASDGDVTAADDYIRVQPYTLSSGRVIPNTAYETAQFEVAILLHSEVMECLIPEPNVSAAGVSFNPVNYRGDFRWLNIPHEDKNPDGTIGHFRGVLSSASKPKKLEFATAVIYDRTSAVRAV